MSKIRFLIFLSTVAIVAFFGYTASLYARGYRFDLSTFKFTPNGLFVANSNPNGAQIFINGELKSATNATLSLAPGTYDVRIEKEGYSSWAKRLVIEKEVVTSVAAALFPAAPSLSAITFSGALSPVPSRDFTKIAYGVPQSPQETASPKGGLWIVETVNLPIGFNRDPRQITNANLTGATWLWSPDSREIMLTTPNGVFLLNSSQLTPQAEMVNVASQKDQILQGWVDEEQVRLKARLQNLPDELEAIFERDSKDIVFSPDEDKILYTATASATIPEGLIKPLPGSSTQKQERTLTPGRKYVFDVKEDRNFFIAQETALSYWLPTSAHIILPEKDKITIADYDGTNRQVVYSGSYEAPHAYPYSSTTQILILTNLGSNGASANLYSLNLK